VSCGRPNADDATNESSLTILFDADERIFGPFWSVDAWLIMFLPLVAWVVDIHTLRITFQEPVAATISDFSWLAMLPKHVLEGLDPEQMFSWPFWVQPIGNGPYRYVRHVPGVMTELAANPAYYGETPKIPTVTLRYGGNPLVELLSGNVDLASSITPLQAVQLAADPRFRVYHSLRANPRDVAIVWNHRNPLFRDVEVRMALTMAIDRRELHRVIHFPDDLPIFDVPALKRHHLQGAVPDPLPFDPERAARLLASAGWACRLTTSAVP